MRHNDARKWLHAALDLLPLILIPVFMIYSHRHTIDTGSIDVPVNRVVDFNQLFEFDGGTRTSVEITNNNGLLEFNGITTGSWFPFSSYELTENDYFILKLSVVSNPNNLSFSVSDLNNGTLSVSPSNPIVKVQSLREPPRTIGMESFDVGTDFTGLKFYFNIFDLTQMFGSGNEPTISQFNVWYNDNYYDYTLSSKQLLKGYSTQTYDDTDIMSQFTYQLYNSVDKYFNMGNVFNMGNIYDWFNLNIFGGNAPISIYIVWNVVLYEFIMDLLFLLYGLFMWFIDMCKHLMEKPLNSIK